MLQDPEFRAVRDRVATERTKRPLRTDVINFLLGLYSGETTYLEIGVRNPDHNFNHIEATHKYSVDPGVEFEANPVDFQLTSDEFFAALEKGVALPATTRFDVVFVDGLHLAEQADRDIANALAFLKEDGFVVLHDCNPPSEWHARESFGYVHTPAEVGWNGTTWKAFLKWRQHPDVQSCCVDTDWGVGVIAKARPLGAALPAVNPFYEYKVLAEHRREHLNLVSFATFQSLVNT